MPSAMCASSAPNRSWPLLSRNFFIQRQSPMLMGRRPRHDRFTFPNAAGGRGPPVTNARGLNPVASRAALDRLVAPRATLSAAAYRAAQNRAAASVAVHIPQSSPPNFSSAPSLTPKDGFGRAAGACAESVRCFGRLAKAPGRMLRPRNGNEIIFDETPMGAGTMDAAVNLGVRRLL